MGMLDNNIGYPVTASEVKGGFLTIVDKKVWQGVIRLKTDNKVLWRCDHLHSRPEYNARYRPNPNRVWEYSALNCGRKAADQWNPAVPDQVVGVTGLVGTSFMESYLVRDDAKMAAVGDQTFKGWVRLRSDGDRELMVWLVSPPVNHEEGMIFPDRPRDNSHWPSISDIELMRWLTAAGLLLSHVWGLTFHNPYATIRVDGVIAEEVLRLTPKEPRVRRSRAHVRPIRKDGKRLFEVVNHSGKVVLVVPHRGTALKELGKLDADKSTAT